MIRALFRLLARPAAYRVALVAMLALLLVMSYLAGMSHGENRGLAFALNPARRHVYRATPHGLVQLDVKPGEYDAVRQLLKEDW